MNFASIRTKQILYLSVIVAIFAAIVPYSTWLEREKSRNDLGEATLGQVDTGSFMLKLALLGGMRGVVANALWMRAQDLQRLQEWDRLKATVDFITKLQPHFLSIWTFQGWNLAYNVSVEWDDPADNFWDNQPDVDDPGHFDAFNVNTWSFKPAPRPWYRTKLALTAIIAAAAAMAAIVVSGVLLVIRGDDSAVDSTVSNSNEVTSSPVTQTTMPTSAAPAQVASSEEPSSPAPPPPPPPLPPPPAPAPAPETVAPPANPAPRYTPTYAPRPTKAPEIGVTRTPVTRQPISVAPQPRTGLP